MENYDMQEQLIFFLKSGMIKNHQELESDKNCYVLQEE